MKFIIEEDSYTYSVDWSKENKIIEGFEEEYFPSCREAVEAFMKLLANIYPPVIISDTLNGELDAKDYADKGRWKKYQQNL